jgi:hypothetical protein
MDSREYPVCFKCIGDTYLAKDIKKMGYKDQCAYCQKQRTVIRLEDIASRIELAISQHYIRTSTQPDDWESALMRDRESDYEWERSGTLLNELVELLADVSPKIANDIVEILDDKYSDFESAKIGEETEFSAASCYEAVSVDARIWEQEWEQFKHSLKHESRYFNRSAVRFLDNIFKGMEIYAHRKAIS